MIRQSAARTPDHAMVLAAGLGTRMRPVTDAIPKPLVRVAGKALIDYVLDKLAAVGVGTAVVNVHHFANQIEQHLASRRSPRIIISDERAQLLDTGGGVRSALPLLGQGPFFLLNSDSLWIDGVRANLDRLADAFDDRRMDALLLLATTATSIGYAGRGDFSMDADGGVCRRGERDVVPFVYAGAAVISPNLFASAPDGRFSLNRLFDGAIEMGRLHGMRLEGVWMHVGTPEAVALAEAAILASAA
jgi:MurNAc alpha-1-phosphate uridylyltransferase